MEVFILSAIFGIVISILALSWLIDYGLRELKQELETQSTELGILKIKLATEASRAKAAETKLYNEIKRRMELTNNGNE